MKSGEIGSLRLHIGLLNIKSVIGFSSFLMMAFGCSQEPEDPGLCSLSCNNAIIGPLQGSIQTRAPVSQITCGPGSAGTVIDPLLFNFIVTESVVTDSGEQLVPLQSVSIEPLVNGLTSPLPEHNVNVEINGTTFTPVRYKGIATPAANWCTDTCGVASLEIATVCPGAGVTTEFSVAIHSGALFSDPAVITVTTLDD